MPNQRLHITGHLTAAELKERYRTCEHPVEKSHYQIIWLLKREENPLSAAETADITGVTPDWVRKLVRRYNQEGADGLKDKRTDNGNEPLLDDEELQALRAALLGKPPGNGLWTGPQVARWISGRKNSRKVSAVTGWHYLRKLGLTLQIPRRKHRDAADAEAQDTFKKNSGRKSPPSGPASRTRSSKSGRKTKPASDSSPS